LLPLLLAIIQFFVRLFFGKPKEKKNKKQWEQSVFLVWKEKTGTTKSIFEA
jgi:hypothetical protein